MLKKRPSKSVWVVLECDPALYPLDREAKRKYFITRDIDTFAKAVDLDIGTGTLKTTGERVSMFQLEPMTVADKALVDDMGSGAKIPLLRERVVGVKNYDGVSFETKDGKKRLTQESMEALDIEVADELYKVILEMGSGADGVDRPFSLPDGWSRGRLLLQQLPANVARGEKHAQATLSLETNRTNEDANSQNS